jgi:hypothetical protein
MNKPAKPKNLADLPKHVRDFKKVLDMYLDPKKPKSLFPATHLIFHATETGYDGEHQVLYMNKKGVICRLSTLFSQSSFKTMNLPAETGKVLFILKEMGYKLPKKEERQAELYRTYMTHVS